MKDHQRSYREIIADTDNALLQMHKLCERIVKDRCGKPEEINRKTSDLLALLYEMADFFEIDAAAWVDMADEKLIEQFKKNMAARQEMESP